MSDHVLSDEDAATYLAIGVSPRDLMRLRLPDLTDEIADRLLWEFTPFPLVTGVVDLADWAAEIPAEVIAEIIRNGRPKHLLEKPAGGAHRARASCA